MSDTPKTVKEIVAEMRVLAMMQNGNFVTVSKGMWECICGLLETRERQYQGVLQLAREMCGMEGACKEE